MHPGRTARLEHRPRRYDLAKRPFAGEPEHPFRYALRHTDNNNDQQHPGKNAPRERLLPTRRTTMNRDFAQVPRMPDRTHQNHRIRFTLHSRRPRGEARQPRSTIISVCAPRIKPADCETTFRSGHPLQIWHFSAARRLPAKESHERWAPPRNAACPYTYQSGDRQSQTDTNPSTRSYTTNAGRWILLSRTTKERFI